ncbi:MAG: alanine racemase [Actinomycetia bacterium]|nr:alanine racemase [Actinomycetes bacterium]
MGTESQQYRNAWAEIDLNKLDRNMELLKGCSAGSQVSLMAVIKADAYGHGAVEVAKRALSRGAYGLGVALVQEGRDLRENGIESPVYVLGEIPSEAVGPAISSNLIPCFSSWKKAREFSVRAKQTGRKVKCHLNIDTGMSRLGINYHQVHQQVEAIAGLPYVEIEGIFTHFACASELGSQLTVLQLERFKEAVEAAESIIGKIRFVHCANSAAFIGRPGLPFNMARVGIAMYGLNPFDRPCPLGLEPVLSLKSRVALLKAVARGQTVSYCGTFRTERDSLIAVVPVGYADGYSRLFSNKARVIVNGKYAPVVGNVTMDQFMVDVTGLGVSVGDEVILIGQAEDKSVTADQLAEIMGTINYEIVCMIGPRIPRIYLT